MATERNLMAYVVDIEGAQDVEVGTNNKTGEAFSKDSQALLEQCIQQKLFSGAKDTLATVGTDSLVFKFGLINWDSLRRIETSIFPSTSSGNSSSTTRKDLLRIFAATLSSLRTQSKEDSYKQKKVLFIGDLKGDLNKQHLATVSEKIQNDEVHVNFIVPEDSSCSAKQKENIETLKTAFAKNHFICIYSIQEALLHMTTAVCKKAVRPVPWNVTLEIGPDLTINVSVYLCSRKNKASETKQALLKTIEHLPLPSSSQPTNESSDLRGPVETSSTEVVAEPSSKMVSKEEAWYQNDGTMVPLDDIVDGYFYGDKLVSFDDIQQREGYKTGDKCFKILLFCPKEQILPQYLIEEGTDLVFPKKGEADADVLLYALIQVLQKSGKVAIVRKIRTTNARISIGVLSPDPERKCLVYVNLCFADDMSIPKFPQLFAAEELEVTTEKDELMDQYIASLSIENFTPFEGPVDPAAQVFRENITRKIVGKSSSAVATIDNGRRSKDNIQLFFENLIKQNTGAITMNIGKQLSLTFPCKEIPDKKNERISGAQVFKKRNLDSTIKEETDEKKLKIETVIEETNNDEDGADQFDVDNLLDDL